MIKIGDTIGGRYVIERQIGEGGMASVWLAKDGTLLRDVAIKFVWQRDPRRQSSMVTGFLREARIAASVVHRNVVQVLDFGLLEDTTPYMVMEALEGKTLGDMFNDGAQFSMPEVAQIALRSLEGLIAVHKVGIVHRDLKPENIFIIRERDGYFPKLLDFGISRSLDRSSGRRSAVTTMDGRIVGTPEYMSPEQAAGTAAVDRRTDIYSMGVILYETIAGDVPYKSDHIGDLILKITAGGAKPLKGLIPAMDVGVSDFVEKAMQIRPENRFDDAGEMFDACKRAFEGMRERSINSVLPPRNTERRQRTENTSSNAEDLEELKSDLRRSPTPLRVPLASGNHATLLLGDKANSRMIFIVAGIVALLVAGVAVFAAMRMSEPATPSNKFIVVQGNPGEESQEAPGASQAMEQPSPSTAPDTQAEPAQERPAPAAVKATAAAPPKARKRSHVAPSPRAAKPASGMSIAESFSRQKASVVRCFAQHTAVDEAQLSVRVSIDKQGRVLSASLTPDRYNDMQVGACIREAVTKMEFGPQQDEISFRVPLVARRGS